MRRPKAAKIAGETAEKLGVRSLLPLPEKCLGLVQRSRALMENSLPVHSTSGKLCVRCWILLLSFATPNSDSKTR